MAEQSPGYLTPAEVAAHYRTTEDTVKHWRYKRIGPKFVRFGRHPLYPRAEIERFDAQLAAAARAPRSA